MAQNIGGNNPRGLQVSQIVKNRKSPMERGNKLKSEWTDRFWIVNIRDKSCYWIRGLLKNTLKVNRRDIDLIYSDQVGENLSEKEVKSSQEQIFICSCFLHELYLQSVSKYKNNLIKYS